MGIANDMMEQYHEALRERNVAEERAGRFLIQRDELAAALLKLTNEANALAEMGRPCLGNTNTSCLLTRITEAHAVLAKLKS